MCSTRLTLARHPIGLLALVVLFLGACSDDGRRVSVASSDLDIGGSVGDGPVVNAEVVFTDALGEVIGSTQSDAQAKYSFQITQGTSLPVTVTASGGIDMVTNRALDFDLVAVANSDDNHTVNLNPQSTFTVATARCLNNDLSDQGLKSTWQRIRGQVGMGLSESSLADPMNSTIDASNAAEVVLSTEALGEAVRRTVALLEPSATETVDGDSVIRDLACDMAYGYKIDGVGEDGVNRTGAVYRTAEAAVLLELIAGDLKVDGQSANTRMNNAVLSIVEAGSVPRDVASVAAVDDVVNQALDSVLLLQSIDTSDVALLGIADALIDSEPSQLRSAVATALNGVEPQVFSDLGALLASPQGTSAGELAVASGVQQASKAPFISLTAENPELVVGESTQISWASSLANRCVASGSDDWEGPVTLSGRFNVGELQQSTEYGMRCYGAGGINRASVKVVVRSGSGRVIEDPDLVAQLPTPTDEANNGNQDTGGAVPDPTPSPVADEQPLANNDEPSGNDAGESDATPTPVDTTEPSGPSVDVVLSASATEVLKGQAVTLTWETQNASSCTARRGWEGARNTSGVLETDPIMTDVTFELTCAGAAGSTSALVTVSVAAPLVVAWQPPEENTDGTAIGNIVGYSIQYGQVPGSYSGEMLINDGSLTRAELYVEPGDYYVAMRTLGAGGVQSELSDEVVISNGGR